MSRGEGARVGAVLLEWVTARAERATIEADVREEIEGHLSRIQEELMSQGLDASTARAHGRARFGDVERLVRDAAKIKSGGSLMLQRVNLALLVVMIAVVGFLMLQMRVSQQRSLAVMQEVSARLEAAAAKAVPADAGVPASGRGSGDAQTNDEHPGAVYITGLVKRPGPYAVPAHSAFTLRRALIAADVNAGDSAVAIVVHRNANGEGTTKSLTIKEIADPAGPDIDIFPNDIISVEQTPKGDPAGVVGVVDTISPQAVKNDSPVVYVRGAVKEPGPYYIKEHARTLREILELAGGVVGEGRTAVVTHVAGHGSNMILNPPELANPHGPDINLEPDDTVTIN